MLLSDGSLKKIMAHGDLGIIPPPDDIQFQPCSIDLRLGLSWQRPDTAPIMSTEYLLHAGQFVIATTAERVTMGKAFVGMVHGRSTWARRGLQVHAAGLIDPGFSGDITLELVNYGYSTLRLLAGERICQLTVERLDWPAARPYGHPALQSHYQHQMGATVAHEGSTQ